MSAAVYASTELQTQWWHSNCAKSHRFDAWQTEDSHPAIREAIVDVVGDLAYLHKEPSKKVQAALLQAWMVKSVVFYFYSARKSALVSKVFVV